jgi:phosphatidate cytidylyltransferase
MAAFGRNIIVRTLSGAVLLAVVLAAVLLSEYSFAALTLIIGAGSMWEFYRIAGRDDVGPQKWYSITAGCAFIAAAFLVASGKIDTVWLAGAVPVVAVIFFAELYRKQADPLFNISVSIGGLFYAALPMALMSFIAFGGGGYDPHIILAYIFTVWVNDIFAYLFGMALGRHRLFERISPKKSWEGFFGGLLCAVAFAVLCGYLTGSHQEGGSMSGREAAVWGGFGLTIALTAVLGDLVESMFKRSAGIKDSGAIIPGHGGFMDRFDALLMSAPFAFVYCLIFM